MVSPILIKLFFVYKLLPVAPPPACFSVIVVKSSLYYSLIMKVSIAKRIFEISLVISA